MLFVFLNIINYILLFFLVLLFIKNFSKPKVYFFKNYLENNDYVLGLLNSKKGSQQNKVKY